MINEKRVKPTSNDSDILYKQIVDFQDVTFQSLSDSKVLCSGAKPSTENRPEKLLLLKSKVSSCFLTPRLMERIAGE